MATTYTAFKAKVQQDLDLEDEVFIQATELLGYTNEGLREIAKDVLTIYEDYFDCSAYLTLVTGTSTYSLPTGIFSRKIRSILYKDGVAPYEILEIKGSDKYMRRALLQMDTAANYQYMIINTSASGPQIQLSPTSRESSSTTVEINFIRTITALTTGSDNVDKDIPECENFLYAYVKGKCKQKENAGSMPPDAQAEIDMQKKLLIDTLSVAIPDNHNELEKDVSSYQESS